MYNNIEINTYISPLLSSNMYMIKAQNRLIVIDPYISTDLLDYIKNNLLTLDFIILTHEHYDHISGVNWLKDIFKTKVICNFDCGKAIKSPALNFSKYFDTLIQLMPFDKKAHITENIAPYSCTADITFKDKKTIDWMGQRLELISTPGHSKGSICILINKKYLFSGDSLLKDYPVVTKLKSGSVKEYNQKTLRYLNSLDSDTKVFPGHYDGFILYDKLKSQRLASKE